MGNSPYTLMLLIFTYIHLFKKLLGRFRPFRFRDLLLVTSFLCLNTNFHISLFLMSLSTHCPHWALCHQWCLCPGQDCEYQDINLLFFFDSFIVTKLSLIGTNCWIVPINGYHFFKYKACFSLAVYIKYYFIIVLGNRTA